MDKPRHDGKAAGRLRQRLAQLLLHSSCAAAATSAASFVGVAKTNAVAATAITDAAASCQEPPHAGRVHETQPQLNAGRQRRRGAQALVHISIDCSTRSGGAAVLPSPTMPGKDVKADVRSRIARRKGGGGGSKTRPPSCTTWWSSSTDTDGELAPFSSDGERGDEPAEARSSAPFSSLSFSSDSTSDFYTTAGAGGSTRSRRHRKPPRRAPKPADASSRTAAAKHGKGASKKDGAMAAAAAGAGGVAVVKRSHDPRADFRSSMVEMVAGRRIRGADALSELLVWYLSLNSPRHHPAILAAFEDVWVAVLGDEP
ncbi:hypothetical protein ACP70R_040670 [Stipagrostis hirtigluma subsp. patula]